MDGSDRTARAQLYGVPTTPRPAVTVTRPARRVRQSCCSQRGHHVRPHGSSAPPRRARSIFHDRVPRLRTPGQPERIIRRSSRSSRLDPGRRRTTTTARSGPRGGPTRLQLCKCSCATAASTAFSDAESRVTQSEGAPLRLSAMTGRERERAENLCKCSTKNS